MNFFKKAKVQPKAEVYMNLNDTSTDFGPTMTSPYSFGAQPQTNYLNPTSNPFGTTVVSSNQFFPAPTNQPGIYGPKETVDIFTIPYSDPISTGKQAYPIFEQKYAPKINLEAPTGAQFNGVTVNYRPQTAPVKKSTRKNYYNQKVPGTIPIERTPIIGAKEMEMVEFDDYFEKHVDKFLSSEIDEIFLYFIQDYLVGLQFCYRDSWGREDRETYKGNCHMSKSEGLKNYFWSSMKLDFDEYVKEIYGEGDNYVTYLKLVTNKGKMIECGVPSGMELKNLIPDLSKVIGVGGSYGMCVSNIYFYYN